jgi:hypothetical protein
MEDWSGVGIAHSVWTPSSFGVDQMMGFPSLPSPNFNSAQQAVSYMNSNGYNHYDSQNGYARYTSEESFNAGCAYNDYHNSWANTTAGSYRAAKYNFDNHLGAINMSLLPSIAATSVSAATEQGGDGVQLFALGPKNNDPNTASDATPNYVGRVRTLTLGFDYIEMDNSGNITVGTCHQAAHFISDNYEHNFDCNKQGGYTDALNISIHREFIDMYNGGKDYFNFKVDLDPNKIYIHYYITEPNTGEIIPGGDSCYGYINKYTPGCTRPIYLGPK